jgi:hypothetical protein
MLIALILPLSARSADIERIITHGKYVEFVLTSGLRITIEGKRIDLNLLIVEFLDDDMAKWQSAIKKAKSLTDLFKGVDLWDFRSIDYRGYRMEIVIDEYVRTTRGFDKIDLGLLVVRPGQPVGDVVTRWKTKYDSQFVMEIAARLSEQFDELGLPRDLDLNPDRAELLRQIESAARVFDLGWVEDAEHPSAVDRQVKRLKGRCTELVAQLKKRDLNPMGKAKREKSLLVSTEVEFEKVKRDIEALLRSNLQTTGIERAFAMLFGSTDAENAWIQGADVRARSLIRQLQGSIYHRVLFDLQKRAKGNLKASLEFGASQPVLPLQVSNGMGINRFEVTLKLSSGDQAMDVPFEVTYDVTGDSVSLPMESVVELWQSDFAAALGPALEKVDFIGHRGVCAEIYPDG